MAGAAAAILEPSGGSSVVELLPSKQAVASSNLVPRSRCHLGALFVAIIGQACADRGHLHGIWLTATARRRQTIRRSLSVILIILGRAASVSGLAGSLWPVARLVPDFGYESSRHRTSYRRTGCSYLASRP